MFFLSSQNPRAREGAQIEIGGNARYVSVCRRHFKEGRAHA
jgi:thymidine kinase